MSNASKLRCPDCHSVVEEGKTERDLCSDCVGSLVKRLREYARLSGDLLGAGTT